jgi:hypothetical protein
MKVSYIFLSTYFMTVGKWLIYPSGFQFPHLYNGTNHVLLLSCKDQMRECPWMYISENKNSLFS